MDVKEKYQAYFGQLEDRFYITSPSFETQTDYKYTNKFSVLQTLDELADIMKSEEEAPSELDRLSIRHTCPKSGRILIEQETKEPLGTQTVNKSLPPVELPNGCYEFGADKMGVFLKNYAFSSDEYLKLSNTLDEVQTEINSFIDSRDKFLKHGFLQKRGILLYGPPGNGKSMFIENLVRQYKDKAVVLFLEQLQHAKLLKDLLPDRMKIFILEEFTEGRMDKNILNLLDGPDSMDRMLVIATTNYPERIPMNLIDRPGRLDSLYEIGLPDENVRREYLFAKFDIQDTSELASIVALTKGYSIAYLKDMVVRCQIYDRPISKVIKEFQSRKKKIDAFIEVLRKQRTEALVFTSDDEDL